MVILIFNSIDVMLVSGKNYAIAEPGRLIFGNSNLRYLFQKMTTSNSTVPLWTGVVLLAYTRKKKIWNNFQDMNTCNMLGDQK